MKYSITVPNFGEFADPRVLAELAAEAETSGWDGFFVWDHIVEDKSQRRTIADPWVLLTAAGLATDRIRLGTIVTPVARRRPQKLAREVATLDRLTQGRMVLGVGLGAPIDDEYGSFGEPTDPRELAARLDEGLELLDRLWSGERVTYQGRCHTALDVRFAPTPVQRPRVPIWVGGNWPNRGPLRRAARWDGAVPNLPGRDTGRPPLDRDVRDAATRLRQLRTEAGRADQPFDLVVGGTTSPGPDAEATVAGLAEAGANWWNESRSFTAADLEQAAPIRTRIQAGPPAR